MRVAEIVLVILVCGSVIVARDFRKEYKTKMYFRNDRQSLCTQEEGDCVACLEKSRDCYWCYNGVNDGECKMAHECPNPNSRSRSCTDQPRKYDYDTQRREHNYENRPRETYHENQPREHYYYESEKATNDQVEKELESLLAQEDAPVKTENASLFCGVSDNCSSCVGQDICFWCQSRHRCYSYFNDSLTSHICSDNQSQWYRNQCRYKAHTKPCPLRNASCADCLSDGLCYWCMSTKQCAYYPHKNYTPPDCPKDNVYIDHCEGYGHLMIVLLPILCIIFIPVIIYIIIWLVLCCMRQAGYDPLQPEDEQPKDIEKKKKAIKLQHDSAPSKTDELRKKYGLKNGENP